MAKRDWKDRMEREEDCYDRDGNVIKDCMERLNAEERTNPAGYPKDERQYERKKEESSYTAEDGTKFRTLSERDNYNRYLHKEGQRHMREEGAKREKRARLDPTDSGFDEHRSWRPSGGSWKGKRQGEGGGATPYPKNKRPPTAPAGVAMRKKRVGY